MSAYYNEHDPVAAAWLRELIQEGLIADGEVDERSIEDVRPVDVRGFQQCHWFAGIGGWSKALRLAGVADDEPLFTGSCPCQPFSSASRGRGKGSADSRHWWPTWARLIDASRPRTVFGEQVAQSGGWIDEVCDDLEGMGYSVGAAILPAVAVGHDHARARLYFVGYSNGESEPIRPVDVQVGRLSADRGNARSLVPTHGISSRMALLRGFGNAIVPEVAAGFIQAAIEATSCARERGGLPANERLDHDRF